MKVFVVALVLSIASLSALAAPSNSDLIKKEILNHTFCYTDESNAGWIFGKNGKAVKHAVNLGMPGPGSYYEVEFTESLRTYREFVLVSQSEKLTFFYTEDQTLFEYDTGRTLSVLACNQ